MNHILSLRQIGISIEDIKKIPKDNEYKEILNKRKIELEKSLLISSDQLSKINLLLNKESEKMISVSIKSIPEYIVFYKQGTIKKYEDIGKFVLDAGDEARNNNLSLKCIVPDYCYVSYLDKGYKDKNIKVEYAQAVEKTGNESENIQFKIIKPVEVAFLYHKGTYSNLRESYTAIMEWIENNNYIISEPVREVYIDGI